MEHWREALTQALAAGLQRVRPILGDPRLRCVALDCHPWHGHLGICVLTQQEVEHDPSALEPVEMASWRGFGVITGENDGGLEELGARMLSAYLDSVERPACARAYLRASANALVADACVQALLRLRRAEGFRLSVTHPDDEEEFVTRMPTALMRRPAG